MHTLFVLAAKEKDHRATPFIVGAFNFDFLHDLPLEDYEEQIEKLQNTWTPDAEYYEWREFKVKIDDESLEDLFKIPLLEGYLENN